MSFVPGVAPIDPAQAAAEALHTAAPSTEPSASQVQAFQQLMQRAPAAESAPTPEQSGASPPIEAPQGVQSKHHVHASEPSESLHRAGDVLAQQQQAMQVNERNMMSLVQAAPNMNPQELAAASMQVSVQVASSSFRMQAATALGSSSKSSLQSLLKNS